jgi:hypothetical protein
MTTSTAVHPTSTIVRRAPLGLRAALGVDAAITGVNGIAYLALAGPLADLFDLPATLLRVQGAFLVLFAVAVAVVATRRAVPRLAAWDVVAVNAAWAAYMLVTVLADLGTPGTVGAVWLLLQGVVVTGFAALQALALRAEKR